MSFSPPKKGRKKESSWKLIHVTKSSKFTLQTFCVEVTEFCFTCQHWDIPELLMGFINQFICGQQATGIRSQLSRVQPSPPHRPLLWVLYHVQKNRVLFTQNDVGLWAQNFWLLLYWLVIASRDGLFPFSGCWTFIGVWSTCVLWGFCLPVVLAALWNPISALEVLTTETNEMPFRNKWNPSPHRSWGCCLPYG